MTKQKYIPLMACALMLFCSSASATPYAEYERVTNRLGEVKESVANLPIEEIENVLLPSGYTIRFTNDELRNHLVKFRDGQKWHEALGEVGRDNHIVFLVDGADKVVIAHMPGTGREPGVSIINSRSSVFLEDPHTQDILKRAQVNEVNWRRKKLQEEIRFNQERKRQLDETLKDMERERETLEQKSLELASRTTEAIKTAESKGNNYSVSKVVEPKSNPMFVFYVKTGLVLGDNVMRMAEAIGYKTVTVDEIVPKTCDWPQEYEYTISGSDPLQEFTDYVSPIGFDVSFNQATKDIYLKFVGDVSQFMGCN